ncbi:unnamed protein product [Amoebophrya sp. A120]|nr:unnamed protein product [Amoebophrya sp. A120]|eukprot:GSA120T00010002001.1
MEALAFSSSGEIRSRAGRPCWCFGVKSMEIGGVAPARVGSPANFAGRVPVGRFRVCYGAPVVAGASARRRVGGARPRGALRDILPANRSTRAVRAVSYTLKTHDSAILSEVIFAAAAAIIPSEPRPSENAGEQQRTGPALCHFVPASVSPVLWP